MNAHVAGDISGGVAVLDPLKPANQTNNLFAFVFSLAFLLSGSCASKGCTAVL